MMQQIIARFPGISCAWTEEAGRVATECYGMADEERGCPVDAHTIFPACSVSKFITAICVMKLQEHGLIDINVPVNIYLQQWKLRTLNGAESGASIRSLLSHTAGIVDGEDGFYGHRRGDPEISLMDILEGRTAYNNRPVRAEKPHGTAFEYSDAGYCVLQQMIEDVTDTDFADAAKAVVLDALGLQNTFFGTTDNMERFAARMAVGYDGDGTPIPGRFPLCPDLAASGLWTTPAELATPVERFPWTGLGLFIGDRDTLVTQGWGENGQCMLKMNCCTGAVSVVMTNRNPEVDQAASGVEWLTDQHLDRQKT